MAGQVVKVYSKAKEGNVRLSKNFTVKEFACSMEPIQCLSLWR